MVTSPASYVVVAKVGAATGLKGFCRLNTFANEVESLLKKSVFVKRKGVYLPCPQFELLSQGGRFLIRFEGCLAPEETRPYVNLELAILQDSLPPCAPDEFYWVELEGMNVVNTHQIPLGKVQYVFESGASDILVIQGEREHLIPFVDAYILSIDRAQRLIIVDWDSNF